MLRLAIGLLLTVAGSACSASAVPSGARPAPAPPLAAGSLQQPYAAQPAKHPGGTVVIGHPQFPVTLSPLFPGGTAATAVENLLFAGLLGLDPNLGWYPDLASQVPQAPLVGPGDVTYRIRPGLHWSDGAPIDADDVIYTWQLVTGPNNPFPSSADGYNRIASVERRSDLELVLHFKEPYPAYPLLFGGVLPKHRLLSLDLTRLVLDPYWSHPDVVSGPFQISELASGDHITLVRNPHYGDGRDGTVPAAHPAYLDRVVFRAYPSRSALLAALKAGEVQVGMGLGERDLDTVSAMSNVVLRVLPELQYEQVTFNRADPNPVTGKGPLWAGDPELLRALDLSLDRPALIAGPLRGRAPAATSPIGPAQSWAQDTALPARAYDPRQAEQILDADGWARGSDGIRVKSGRRLSFVLSTNNGNPLRAHEEELMVAGWKRVGVEAKLQNFPTDTLFASLDAGGVLAAGRFEAALWAWVLPPDPDADFGLFHSSQIPTAANHGSGSNYSRCQDPRIDSALAEGRAGYDQARRSAAYRAFQEAYLTARCELPLYRHLDVAAVSPRLHNYAAHPAPVGDTWNAADWWIDP